MTGPIRLYGLAEIARELGLDVKQVRMWKHRGKLPEPTYRLKAGQFWQGPEIEDWIWQHRTTDDGGHDVKNADRRGGMMADISKEDEEALAELVRGFLSALKPTPPLPQDQLDALKELWRLQHQSDPQ